MAKAMSRRCLIADHPSALAVRLATRCALLPLDVAFPLDSSAQTRLLLSVRLSLAEDYTLHSIGIYTSIFINAASCHISSPVDPKLLQPLYRIYFVLRPKRCSKSEISP